MELRTLVAGDPAVVSHKLFMRSPYQLFVIDGNRFGEPRAVAIRRMVNARTLNEFQLGLEQLIAAIGQARAEAIETIAKRRPIWRYFDFVYFSAVTLSTLGYGDIVPATRASRFLVASESTAGVLLIAFAFAFVWPPQEPSDVKKTST